MRRGSVPDPRCGMAPTPAGVTEDRLAWRAKVSLSAGSGGHIGRCPRNCYAGTPFRTAVTRRVR